MQLTLGVVLGKWERNYLLSSLTAGLGGPGSPFLGVHMCERQWVSGACGLASLLGWVRVPEFLAFVALRLRQSIGPLQPSSYR